MKFEEKLLNKLFDQLFPINRSIMGDGYRKSLKILGFYFDFKYKKFKTKKKFLIGLFQMNGILQKRI